MQLKMGAHMSMSEALLMHDRNSSIAAQSNYVVGKIGECYQIFSKDCTGNDAFLNRKVGTPKAHWSCNSCNAFVKSKRSYKISQTICNQSKKIKHAIVASERVK